MVYPGMGESILRMGARTLSRSLSLCRYIAWSLVKIENLNWMNALTLSPERTTCLPWRRWLYSEDFGQFMIRLHFLLLCSSRLAFACDCFIASVVPAMAEMPARMERIVVMSWGGRTSHSRWAASLHIAISMSRRLL